MKIRQSLLTLILVSGGIACTQQSDDAPTVDAGSTISENESGSAAAATVESIEIAPGLSARILKAGDGQAAAAGDNVEVHYTGWLYDPQAEQNRGDKFDSSVDRGQTFQFPLGAGRVIKGWDQGVDGMQIGEVRELTIAPEMGYGDRGAGDVIPPGATLIFEVELFALENPGAGASQ